MKFILYPILTAFIFFNFSFYSCKAQSDFTKAETQNLHLKSSVDGLFWSGITNHFSLTNDSSHLLIFTNGNAYLNCNTLPFSFTKNLVRSRFLDNTIKENAASKIKNRNGASFGYKYGAGFCTKKNKNSIGLEVSDESISVVNYRKDLFKLIFFGNAEFENDTAYLSGINFANQDFHRARFILSTQSGTGDSSWQINASLSFLQGYHVNLLNTGLTTLFTAPMGEYLLLQSQLIYKTNDTSKSGTFAFNGNGISVDVCIAFPAGKSRLMFTINDAGFINWNKKSLYYGMDTTIKFEGVELENILSNSGHELGNINTDTILNYLGVYKGNDNFNLNLPLRFSLTWNKMISKNKIGLNAGFSLLPHYETVPLFFASATFFQKNLYPTLSVSYGGLQAFNMGINLEGNFGSHFNFQLGTGQFLSLVFQKKLTGFNLFSQLSYSF